MADFHTYTAHLQFEATSDADAIRIARIIKDLVEFSDITPVSRAGYHVDRLDVTDADDWAEDVSGLGEGICSRCNYPADDRVRVGDGSRWCAPCVVAAGKVKYEILDAGI